MITERITDSLGRNRPIMTDRIATAANLVINHGVDPKEALELATGKPVPKRTVDGFKDKVRRYALTAPSLVKAARNVVKDAMQFKAVEINQQTVNKQGQVVEYTEKIIPSYTNALAASAMVLDRDQPIKHVNLNVSASISPVNLDDFMG